MKKINLIILVLLFFVLSSCQSQNKNIIKSQDINNEKVDNEIKIVTTIFPIYDWCVNILGDKYNENNITYLLDNGIDLHNYQPTVNDIMKINKCDLFIYVGGESDKWVENTLSKIENKQLKKINLLEVLGNKAKIEEEKEGMQEEVHEDEESDEHEEEIDEHVWLSLRNAQLFVKEITNAISEIDSSNKNYYIKNSNNYIKQLDAVDKQLIDLTNTDKKIVLLFGDRFPFRYFVDDYNIDYYAAFKGCSAETEASFETIAFLSNKLDELDLDYVMTIEGDNHNIAQTIINNSSNKNRKIFVLNSMQGITKNDMNSGMSYLGCMYRNKQVLEEALKE